MMRTRRPRVESGEAGNRRASRGLAGARLSRNGIIGGGNVNRGMRESGTGLGNPFGRCFRRWRIWDDIASKVLNIFYGE